MATVIAAVDRKNGIGNGGTIPFWSDMAFFKTVTVGHLVIMGRRTWESLKGKPLSDRINVIVSTTLPGGRFFTEKGGKAFYVFHSLAQALDFAKEKHPEREAFIIGGEVLYRAAFEQGVVNKVIISKIGVESECDTFFPLTLNQLEEKFGKHKVLSIDNDGIEPVIRLQYVSQNKS